MKHGMKHKDIESNISRHVSRKNLVIFLFPFYILFGICQSIMLSREAIIKSNLKRIIFEFLMRIQLLACSRLPSPLLRTNLFNYLRFYDPPFKKIYIYTPTLQLSSLLFFHIIKKENIRSMNTEESGHVSRAYSPSWHVVKCIYSHIQCIILGHILFPSSDP